jgi:hypothetical protein
MALKVSVALSNECCVPSCRFSEEDHASSEPGVGGSSRAVGGAVCLGSKTFNGISLRLLARGIWRARMLARRAMTLVVPGLEGPPSNRCSH